MARPQGSQSLIVTTFRLPFTTHKNVGGDASDDDNDDNHDDNDDVDSGVEQEGEAVGRTESRDEWAR